MIISKIKEKVLKDIEDKGVISQGDIPDTLPIIPLRETVIYPFTVIPLFLTEEKSLKAVEDA